MTRKIKRYFYVALFPLIFVSCGGIFEDEFFGAKFGASKDEVREAFEKYSFIERGSDYSNISFEKENEDNFSFKGFNWNTVAVGFNEIEEFCSVGFGYSTENEDEAKKIFEKISKQYMNSKKIDEGDASNSDYVVKEDLKVTVTYFSLYSVYFVMLTYEKI